jgi:hypothetical protein
MIADEAHRSQYDPIRAAGANTDEIGCDCCAQIGQSECRED